MIIDHVGIAVKSLEQSVAHWERVFGYRQLTAIVVNTRQKVRVVFLAKENSLTVKLIEATDSASPVHAFAQRGGGLHHLCFKCAQIEGELAKLSSQGLRVLVKPQPGEAFDNEDIAFVFDPQGLNIELIDTDKKACLIDCSAQ